MAVYTIINNDQLDGFLDHYKIGPVLSFKGIAEGVENSNYFLQTEKENFILTLYEKRVQEKDLPFFLGLMNHLAAKGLRVAAALTGKNGTLYHRLAARPAALISFLQGRSPTDPSSNQCAQLGTALAQMHLAAQDFPMRRENQMAVKSWHRLLASCENSLEQSHQGLRQEIKDEIDLLQASWPQGLPQGIIHADLFPDNALFDPSALTPGIIDFYFACHDQLAYDLAICLNAWCFTPQGAPIKEKTQAMIQHYSQTRELSQDELQALPILCRGAALRFLLTRLLDWLSFQNGQTHVSPKDPKEYLRLMRFHKNGGAFLGAFL